MYKYKAQAVKMHATSIVLTNELNANLAAEWNAVKKNKANSTYTKKVEPLSSRREASLIGFLFKLLDGDGRGELNAYVPVLSEHSHIFNSRHDSSSIQIKTRVDLRETTGNQAI